MKSKKLRPPYPRSKETPPATPSRPQSPKGQADEMHLAGDVAVAERASDLAPIQSSIVPDPADVAAASRQARKTKW